MSVDPTFHPDLCEIFTTFPSRWGSFPRSVRRITSRPSKGPRCGEMEIRVKPQSGIHGLMEKNMKKNWQKFPKAAPAAEKSFQFVIGLSTEQFKGLCWGPWIPYDSMILTFWGHLFLGNQRGKTFCYRSF